MTRGVLPIRELYDQVLKWALRAESVGEDEMARHAFAAAAELLEAYELHLEAEQADED